MPRRWLAFGVVSTLCIFLSLFLSFYFFDSLFFSLPLSFFSSLNTFHSLFFVPISLILSLFLSHSLSFSLFIYLTLSLSVDLFFFLNVSFLLSLTLSSLFLSLSLSLSFFVFVYIYFSLSHTLSISLFLTLFDSCSLVPYLNYYLSVTVPFNKANHITVLLTPPLKLALNVHSSVASTCGGHPMLRTDPCTKFSPMRQVNPFSTRPTNVDAPAGATSNGPEVPGRSTGSVLV